MTKLLGGKIVLACICDFFKIKNNLLGGGVIVVITRKKISFYLELEK